MFPLLLNHSTFGLSSFELVLPLPRLYFSQGVGIRQTFRAVEMTQGLRVFTAQS